MSESTHAKVLRSIVNKLMADPEQISVFSDYLGKLRSGYFDKSYVDRVLQKPPRFSEYDIYDAYAFAQFHFLNSSGKLASATVNIGLEPRDNTQVEYHNDILRKGKIFHGKFVGGLADSDGYMTWDKPLEFQTMHASESDDTIDRRGVIIMPRTLPLEVGYTEGSRTLLHLQQGDGLARWPYGSKEITLYVNLDQS